MHRPVSRIAGLCALLATVLLPVAAQAAPDNQNVPLLVGPPVTNPRLPYDLAHQCLKRVLTPQQKKTTFTVSDFPDLSNKANFVSDSGVGSFSTQGAQYMLYTSLRLAGVQVTDLSIPQRAMIDWSMQKIVMSNGSAPRTGQPRIRVGLKFPDVSISGAITSFDVNMSSGGFSIKVGGVGASRRKNRILVGMDARVTEMIGGERPDGTPTEAGAIPTVVRINKQIVGYENAAGATRFFGNGGATTLIDVDFGTRKNEAIQQMERVMIDGLAARLIADYFGITACDRHIDYGDRLLVPLEPEVPVADAAATPAQAAAQETPASTTPAAAETSAPKGV